MITRFEEPGRGHALRILPMVDEIMAEAGLSLRELGGIGVGVGPGAFTGVRISVAVAQGLAFGADLKLLPVTSLEALALQAFEWPAAAGAAGAPGSVLACLDARMGELYWGYFRPDALRGVATVGGLHVGKPEDVPSDLPTNRPADMAAADAGAGGSAAIGRGMRILNARGNWVGRCDQMALPRAEHIAKLAALRLALGEGIDPAQIVPVYLRDKVAFTEAERAAAK